MLLILIYQSNSYFRLHFLNDQLASSCLKKPFLRLSEAQILPGGFRLQSCEFFVSWHCVGIKFLSFCWLTKFCLSSYLAFTPSADFCVTMIGNLSKLNWKIFDLRRNFLIVVKQLEPKPGSILTRNIRSTWGRLKCGFWREISWFHM